jgi:hypothetical protein
MVISPTAALSGWAWFGIAIANYIAAQASKHTPLDDSFRRHFAPI